MKKILFYALNLTWGGIMTVIGGVVALVLYSQGKRPEKHGGCWCFTVGKSWGGVSLGLVMLVCDRAGKHTRDHEFGHSIQNALYGVAFPFIVAIPSAIRWFFYTFSPKRYTFPPYDSVWFEAQATEWGEKYIDKWGV